MTNILNSDPTYFSSAIDLWNRSEIGYSPRTDVMGHTRVNPIDSLLEYSQLSVDYGENEVLITIAHELAHQFGGGVLSESRVERWAQCVTERGTG
jgi:hypothetical protein